MIPIYDDLYKSISSVNVAKTLINVVKMTQDNDDDRYDGTFDHIKPSMITLEESLFIKSLNLDITEDYDLVSNTYCNRNIRVFYFPDRDITNQDGSIDSTGIKHFIFRKNSSVTSDNNTFYTVVFDRRFKGDNKLAFKLCRYIIDLYLLCYNDNDPNFSFSTIYFDNVVSGSIAQFEYCAAVFKALDKTFNLKFNDFDVYIKDNYYNYKLSGIEIDTNLLNKIYTWAITLDNANEDLDREHIIEQIFDYNMKENIL